MWAAHRGSLALALAPSAWEKGWEKGWATRQGWETGSRGWAESGWVTAMPPWLPSVTDSDLRATGTGAESLRATGVGLPGLDWVLGTPTPTPTPLAAAAAREKDSQPQATEMAKD